MRKAVLDTNIISYFFRGQPKVVEQLRQYGQFHDRLTFSLLTYYEIRSGLLYRDAKTLLTRFQELAADSEILPLTLITMNIEHNLRRSQSKRTADYANGYPNRRNSN